VIVRGCLVAGSITESLTIFDRSLEFMLECVFKSFSATSSFVSFPLVMKLLASPTS